MRAVRFLYVAIFSICGVPSTPALTQAQSSANAGADPWFYGFDGFKLLLEQKLDPVDDATGGDRQRVVVILGDSSGWESKALTRFTQGAAVLVASDRKGAVYGCCDVASGPVLVSEADAYRSFRDCSQVTVAAGHRLMEGVGSLVANRPGWLSRMDPRASVIAQLPESSSIRYRGRDTPIGARPLIAARDALRGNGKLIVVADHSMFINGMLMHGDNALFAINVAEYLTEGRTQLEFVVDGVLQDDIGAPPLPLPEELPDVPEESLLAFANNFLTSFEDENLHNELAANRPRDLHPARYKRALLLGLAFVVALYAISRLPFAGRTYRERFRSPVRTTSEARCDTQLAYGALYPAARSLARSLLFKLGAEPIDDSDKLPVPGDENIQFDGSNSERRRVRNELQEFAKIANDGRSFRKPFRRSAGSMSPRQLKRLAARLQKIEDLADAGRLRLVAPLSGIS